MRIVSRFILGILLLPSLSYSLTCEHDDQTKLFCQNIFEMEDCLQLHNRCDEYVAGAMVKSVLLLGKIDAAATFYASVHALNGEIGDRFARLASVLADQRWQVVSRDPNWIVAGQKVIDLTDEYAKKFQKMANEK